MSNDNALDDRVTEIPVHHFIEGLHQGSLAHVQKPVTLVGYVRNINLVPTSNPCLAAALVDDINDGPNKPYVGLFLQGEVANLYEKVIREAQETARPVCVEGTCVQRGFVPRDSVGPVHVTRAYFPGE